MSSCILAAVLSAGIALAVIVSVAVVVVLATGTFGTVALFTAAVAALLASWWFPIATSVLAALGLAYALCLGGTLESNQGGVGVSTMIALATTIPLSAAILSTALKVPRISR